MIGMISFPMRKKCKNIVLEYPMIGLCTYFKDNFSVNEFHRCTRQLSILALIKREGKWELIEGSRHKITSEKLKKTEEKYRLLFDNMRDGFAYCEMIYGEGGNPINFIFLNANDALEKLPGMKNVVGKRIHLK